MQKWIYFTTPLKLTFWLVIKTRRLKVPNGQIVCRIFCHLIKLKLDWVNYNYRYGCEREQSNSRRKDGQPNKKWLHDRLYPVELSHLTWKFYLEQRQVQGTFKNSPHSLCLSTFHPGIPTNDWRRKVSTSHPGVTLKKE